MAELEIRLLGDFEARLGGRPLSFPTRHSAQLLAYLAAAPDVDHERERLASLFWPDRMEEQARTSLRQTLYRLRKLLGNSADNILEISRRTVRVSGAQIWCDLIDFERAIGGDLDQVVLCRDLYRGDFFANLGASESDFDQWVLEQRQSVKKMAMDGFLRLAESFGRDRRLTEMEVTARELVKIDAYDERATRLVMTACALQGQRNAALGCYKSLEDQLERELGIAPEAETTTLYATIRAGDSPVGYEAPRQAAQSADDPGDEAPRPDAPGIARSHKSAEPDAEATVGLGAAERKDVTILFAELASTSGLLSSGDPEELVQRTGPVINDLCDQVRDHRGIVLQSSADTVLGLFGAPLAEEEHTVSAGRAALAMLPVARSAVDADLALRIGLHAGLALVGSFDQDRPHGIGAIGPVVQLADRIARVTNANTIALSAAVQDRLDGYFQMQPIGQRELHGLTEPIALFELVASTSARTRWEAWSSRRLTEFVGRETELQAIHRVLDLAHQGEGQILGIVGEPGVGKSRMVHEFLKDPAAERCAQLYISAAAHDGRTAYLPISNLLRTWLEIDEKDTTEEIAEKLATKASALDGGGAAHLPALSALLGLPIADPKWNTIGPSERRYATISALKAILHRESRDSTLVLVLEDLHWFDEETIAILDGILEVLPRSQILILATYRPEHSPLWVGRSVSGLVRLKPLKGKSADAFLRSLTGDKPGLSAWRRHLLEKTGGIPLFMEEAIRALDPLGSRDGDQESERLIRALDRIQIPSSVEGVIASRIDRLRPTEKRLLQVASVTGEIVPLSILRLVAGLDEVALTESLSVLQASEFLYERSPLPNCVYSFEHALTFDVTYNSILRAERQELHRHLLEAIESRHSDRLDEHVEQLARHALLGEAWDKAAIFLQRAGDRSVELCAYRMAREHFEAAIEALGHLPDTGETAERAIALRLKLRPVLNALGDTEGLLDHLTEAEELARRNEHSTQLLEIYVHRSYLLSTLGHLDVAIDAAKHAQDLSRTLKASAGQREADLAFAQASCLAGESNEVIERLSPNLDYWKVSARHDRFGHLGTRSVWCLGYTALANMQLGEFPEAIAAAEEALKIAEEVDRSIDLQFANYCKGAVHVVMGDLELGIPTLEKSVALSQSTDNEARIIFPRGACDLGYGQTLAGNFDAARQALDQALEEARRLGLIHVEAWIGIRSAGLELLVGDTGLALELCRETLERNQAIKDRCLQVVAERTLGAILMAHGDKARNEARRRLESAKALAESGGLRPELAHCHGSLAELLSLMGEAKSASEQSSLAQKLYKSMGMRRFAP